MIHDAKAFSIVGEALARPGSLVQNLHRLCDFLQSDDQDVALITGYAGLAIADLEPEGMFVALRAFQCRKDFGYHACGLRTVIEVRKNKFAAYALRAAALRTRDFSLCCRPFDGWEPPVAQPPVSREAVDSWIRVNHMKRVRTYSEPTDENPIARHVILVALEEFSLFVLKEVFDESDGPLGKALADDREHLILSRLHGIDNIPKLHGVFNIEGRLFLLRDVLHGPSLRDTELKENHVGERRATIQSLFKIASTLTSVHQRGVAMLDIRPANLMLNGGLFDFSHARSIPQNGEVASFIMNGRHTAPEVLSTRIADLSTDVFSFGVVMYTALCGNLPFAPIPHMNGGTPEHDAIKYGVPNALRVFNTDEQTVRSLKDWSPDIADLVSRCLSLRSERRPTMEEVATTLEFHVKAYVYHRAMRVQYKETETRGLALLPMRASVPHVDHANLIARVLDAGFDVSVAMQQAFLLKPDHPVPAWLSARIIRAQLRAMGYDTKHVTFYYNHFVNEREHRLRFLMHPQWERITTIVSGTESTFDLLRPIAENRVFLSASSFFPEGMSKNSGTLLRSMLKDSDFYDEQLFHMYSPAMNKVCSLTTLRKWLERSDKNPIDYVPGRARVCSDGLLSLPLLPWEGPEEAIMRHLRSIDPHTTLVERDGTDILTFRGVTYTVAFNGEVYLNGDDEFIGYSIEPELPRSYFEDHRE